MCVCSVRDTDREYERERDREREIHIYIYIERDQHNIQICETRDQMVEAFYCNI